MAVDQDIAETPPTSIAATRETEPEVVAAVSSAEGSPDLPLSFRIGGIGLAYLRPMLLLGVLLIFTGIQLVTMGLLAEIMARTYHESQDKPTYAIREIRETVEPPRPRAIGV